MMKRFVSWTIIIFTTLTLSGCWDAKDVQNLLYISAIGIDHENDHYVIYGHVMSFSGIAKQEGAQAVPTPVWVTKGYGKTINTAMNDFYQKSNQPIYWGHIAVIIYSEKVLKMGIHKVNDSLLRFQQIRETAWVYGTSEPMDKILLVTSLFGSPSQTSLYNPREVYKLHSYLPPLRIQRFFVDYNEPGMTVKLPLLKLEKAVWKGEKEERNTAKLDGVYLLKNKELKGKLSSKEMVGLRWVTKKTIRAPLILKGEEHQDVVVSITRPKVKIKPVFSNGGVRFNIKIKAKANVVNMEEDVALSTLNKEIKKRVKKEIRDSLTYGIHKGADVYNLEEVVYRKNFRKWKKLFENQTYHLTPESIQSIDVNVKISHTGDFKFKHFK
ncbi:Ger(x)C family spore germination protein [Bacillus sp. Bva_UNVM-123]|uniref:Ger(x)C family spore germination protein n=1 Tax=Bacillus sp. Bva_UNVM-123 TaxID=2829798 RepID=UPI00391F05BD